MLRDNYLLNKKISIPLWMVLSLPLAAYVVWEAYWYTRVGLNFITWHTHYAIYVCTWFTGAVVIGYIKNIDRQRNFLLILSSITATFLLIEWILDITNHNKIYIEKRSGFYQSLFNQHSRDSLRSYRPFYTHHLATPEFNYPRQTNSFGFSDEEFYRDTSKMLIQTYGDSFTEGDGAPADSSYPAILRTLLGERYQVQNYGISGNDPGFYVTQFAKVGAKFKPDIIILCYGTYDFALDVMSRGGLERFVKDGWQTHKGPWWEIFYAISYVNRLLFHAAGIHYNDFFMAKAEMQKQLKNLEPKWNEIFVEIARLAEQHHTKVLLIKKPERSEIDINAYHYKMAFFDSFLLNYPVFKHADLMPLYNRQGLTNYESTTPYYWPQDGHHNPRGYAVMAQVVKEALEQNHLLTLSPSAN